MTRRTFLLFAGPCYYPRGGAEDFILSTDTIEVAKYGVPLTDRHDNDTGWAQIAEWKSGRLVILCHALVPDRYQQGDELTWVDGGF